MGNSQHPRYGGLCSHKQAWEQHALKQEPQSAVCWASQGKCQKHGYVSILSLSRTQMPSAVFRKVLSLPKLAKGFSTVQAKLNFAAPKLTGTKRQEVDKRVVLDGQSGDGDWKSRVCWSCWLPRKTARGSDSCRQDCHGPRHPESSLGSSSISILPRLSKADKGNSRVVLPTLFLHRLLLQIPVQSACAWSSYSLYNSITTCSQPPLF